MASNPTLLDERQERPRASRAEVIVPTVDEPAAGRIYDSSIASFALVGALLGVIVLGLLGYALASGLWPVAGLGQFAATGASVGTFVGVGLGVAGNGLVGSLIALYRLPALQAEHHH